MTLCARQVSPPSRHKCNGAVKAIYQDTSCVFSIKLARNDLKTSNKMHSMEGHTGVWGLTVALVYGICSASMAFANKAILNTFNFPYQFFLILVQMVVTVVVLEGLRLTRVITLPRYSLRRGWLFFLPSMFYALHSVLALSALTGMNIPMYGVMKRCAPMVVLLLSVLVFKKDPPGLLVIAAVGMITAGCFITGYGDLSLDVKAYVYGGISVVTQALYLLLVQRCSQSLNATETLHLNSYNTLLPLAVGCLASGELYQVMDNFRYQDASFVVIFVIVVCMGCALNYLLFLCTTLNSALTTAVTGTLKTILQTTVGMFTFGGISINAFTVTGISLNLTGATLYSYAKFYRCSQKDKENQEYAQSITVTNEPLSVSNILERDRVITTKINVK